MVEEAKCAGLDPRGIGGSALLSSYGKRYILEKQRGCNFASPRCPRANANRASHTVLSQIKSMKATAKPRVQTRVTNIPSRVESRVKQEAHAANSVKVLAIDARDIYYGFRQRAVFACFAPSTLVYRSSITSPLISRLASLSSYFDRSLHTTDPYDYNSVLPYRLGH